MSAFKGGRGMGTRKHDSLLFVEDDVEHDLHRFSAFIRQAKRIALAGVLAVSTAGMISCTSRGSGASGGGEGEQLFARTVLSHNCLAALIQTDKMKTGFAEINAD